MFGVLFNTGVLGQQFHVAISIWNAGLCIFFTGIAIKLMDDWLDQEFDACVGKVTVARTLGKATLPYAMLVLVLASLLNPPLAVSLFLGSYSVGMGFQLQDQMPTGLPAYLEVILSVAIGSVLIGIPLMSWSVLMMMSIQLLDDILDLQKDQQSGQRNLALKFGIVETSLLFLGLISACILLNAFLTSLVIIDLPLITLIMEWRQKA